MSMNPLDKSTSLTQEDIELRIKELQYQSYLEQRLRDAKEIRDRVWPEFQNKTYFQYYEQNEKIANTFIEATMNEGDPMISSGTLEGKFNVLLSHIDNLNLTPEVLAYDKNDRQLRSLGVAFTDIIDRTRETDGGDDGGDDEKRVMRQRELLKQGTVFVQERWATKKQMKKKLTSPWNKKFRGVKWEEKLEVVFEGPERELLYGPNVYLGDITKFSIDDQPYIFTVETMTYDKAKEVYGEYENWKFVRPGMPPASEALLDTGGRTIYDGKFRMTRLEERSVEIIKYQDPTRDDFQIIVNGIMMLPIGFPLSAVTPAGKFNVTKQLLYPINAQFAYGKSFVSSGDVYELSKVLDEMLRLFVLKTRKSITPPYVNISGKIISRKSLLPGVISMGIAPNALHPIGNESQGVTAGEFQVYQEILTRIENSTVSPVFQGQYGKSNTTATEVLEVQRQARLALGIIISACTMLEVKLGYLRLWNIIQHWFTPIGEYMDDGGIARSKYRQVSRQVDIEGAGRGTRMVIPIDGALPTSDVVRIMEIEDEKKTGQASERIYLSPLELRKHQVRWRVAVNPQERVSSAYEKVLFREQLQDILALVNLGAIPNVEGLQEKIAKIYNMDMNMMFSEAQSQQMAQLPSATETSGKLQGGASSQGGAQAEYSQQIQAGIA